MTITITARPPDARTLDIHSFELVPKTRYEDLCRFLLKILVKSAYLKIFGAFHVDFRQIFWVLTNFIMHDFRDTQNHVTRGPTCTSKFIQSQSLSFSLKR